MEKNLETAIVHWGVYWDNRKEKGNYYNILEFILGLYPMSHVLSPASRSCWLAGSFGKTGTWTTPSTLRTLAPREVITKSTAVIDLVRVLFSGLFGSSAFFILAAFFIPLRVQELSD